MTDFAIDGFFGRWFVGLNSEAESSDIGLTGDCALYDISLRHDFLVEMRNSASVNGHLYKSVGKARWPEIPIGTLEVKNSAFGGWK